MTRYEYYDLVGLLFLNVKRASTKQIRDPKVQPNNTIPFTFIYVLFRDNLSSKQRNCVERSDLLSNIWLSKKGHRRMLWFGSCVSLSIYVLRHTHRR